MEKKTRKQKEKEKEKKTSAHSCGFTRLPSDLLRSILSFMDPRSHLNMARVCQLLHSESRHKSSWSCHFVLSGTSRFNDMGCLNFRDLDLKMLVLENAPFVTTTGIILLLNLRQGAYDHALSQTSRQLMHFEINYKASFSDEVLFLLRKHPLQILRIGAIDTFQAPSFYFFQNMPLRELSIGQFWGLRDEHFRYLEHTPLQVLKIKNNHYVTLNSLTYLKAAPLKHLAFCNNNLLPEHVSVLSLFDQLEQLEFIDSDGFYEFRDYKNIWQPMVEHVKMLRELTVSFPLNDGIQYLKQAKNLKCLTLYYYTHFLRITNLEQLQELGLLFHSDFFGDNMVDEFMVVLRSLKKNLIKLTLYDRVSEPLLRRCEIFFECTSFHDLKAHTFVFQKKMI